MTRQQLVEEYVSGRLSRRAFVEKLVKAGVSVGAALTYAVVLAPQRAAAVSDDPDKRLKKVQHELRKACKKNEKDPEKALEDVADLYQDFPEFAFKFKEFPTICKSLPA